MEGGCVAHRVVEVVPAPGQLEAGDRSLHGGIPRPADPPATTAVVTHQGSIVRARHHRDEPALHADPWLRDGRDTHEDDVRIAEGLQNISLPEDPAMAIAGWR